jgi:hypothetical protein
VEVVAKEAVSGRARGAAAVLVEGVMAEHRDDDKRLRWCLLVAQGYFWA